MWFDSAGWGVTPAAAGGRVTRGRDGRELAHAPTHLRPARPSSLDRAPRGHAPGGLHLLRFVFVLSVAPL